MQANDTKTFFLTQKEIATLREALRSLWNREYSESQGQRGGWRPTKALRDCEALREKFGDYDYDSDEGNRK